MNRCLGSKLASCWPLLAVAALLMSSCGRGDPVPPKVNPDAREPTSRWEQPEPPLDESLILWKEGQRAEALAAFAETDWQDPTSAFTLSLLNLSEREFTRQSPAEQSRIRDDALRLSGEIRTMARAIHAEYMRLQSEGEPEQAQRLMNGLEHFAIRLQDRDRRLAIFNLLGEALQNIVDQHRVLPLPPASEEAPR